MRLILVLVQMPMALMILYLDILTLAATRWRSRIAKNGSGHHDHKFAVLIPAHNEELLLPRLLQSIRAVDYPAHLYTVFVVADNCTDQTATIARAAGATVYERTDVLQRGKGYALRWLLDQLQRDEGAYHGYVFVDADSVISTNFLTVMSAHLDLGEQVIQSYYGVSNHDTSWPATLRYIGLALYNDLRPRGRDVLNLSVGLRGNGMCFAASIVERFGWGAHSLAEDAEFHLQLVAAGVRVSFAGEAAVLSDMPTSLRQSHGQNVRWERGRLQMLRDYGPRLLTQGIWQRDTCKIDAIAEQLVPPLSVVTGLTSLAFLVTTALPSRTSTRTARRLALALWLGQIAYVFTGLRLVGAGIRAYAALLFAPLYIVWKIWVYARAALNLNDNHWVRTARASEELK